MTDELWTLKEVCAYTKLSKWTLYERKSERRVPIPVYRFGNVLRFRKSDVIEWVESHREKGLTQVNSRRTL